MSMKRARRSILGAMLILAFMSLFPGRDVSAQSLSRITDDATGVILSLPVDLVASKKGTKRGTNWQSQSSRLSIDTLNFGNERSLSEIYDTLKGLAGRRLTASTLHQQRFALDGTDSDGSWFQIVAAEKNGNVRGLSVVYFNRSSAALARSIVNSFLPFPDSQTVERTTRQIAETPSRIAIESRVGGQSPTCHLAGDAPPFHAPGITVSIRQKAAEVRTGDPIVVEWKAAPGLNLACRTPLYLVLSTPMRTRFEGEKFLALPPKTEAPFGITHRLDRTRIFVPLHVGVRQHQGQVVVKAYESGPFSLDWALIEVPKRTSDPRTRQDFAIGQQRATTPAALGQHITVVGGNPAVVVRDQFPTDTPKEVIRSNSGEFELHVFDDFYRVLVARSGELLQERAGWDPNFSPSSRFLGAYAAGPGLEVIDLYSGNVITSNDILHREGGFRGNVHMAAWSPGDGLVALSVQGYGGIAVRQSLVDGPGLLFPQTSCHHCRGIHSALRVDAEAGVASFQGQQTGWASLLDRSAGTAAAARQALTRFPRQSWESDYRTQPSKEQQAIVERREALAQQISATMIGDLANTAFFKADDFLTGFDADNSRERIEENWRFPGKIQLSHLCLQGTKGRCVGRLADYQDRLTDPEDENLRLAKMRVAHSGQAPISGSAAEQSLQLADARLMDSRRISKRGSGDDGVTPPATVWDRLAQHLSATLKPLSNGTSAKDASEEPDARAAIVRSLPKASVFLRPSSSGDYIDAGDILADAYYGLEKEASLIDPRAIRQLATWQVGDRTYWLIHAFFDYGASSRHWLFLLHGTRQGPSTLVDLTHRLRYRVGRNPSGLDEYGKIEITEEYATTMGFGGWPNSFDTASIAFNRYLVIAGRWTIDARRWVLLYDLGTNQIRFFNRDVPESSAPSQLAVTEDGRTIVQVNSNGHLYFHDVASGKLILRGFDIDDELVVYEHRGYYVASPEGAQFVYLKFPGLPGYNSFQQFARTLNRPDLVHAALNGKLDAPDPLLTAPPKLSLDVQVAGTGNARSAKLKWTATSAVGLERVKLYVDGRLESEHALTGKTAISEATIALPPEARWVTAVAVDSKGYESVPQGRDLVGAKRAITSRLFAIAVGTDRYEDAANIPQLRVAKADAQNFGNSVAQLKDGTYGSVEVTTFLDSTRLREALPIKIRDLVAKAGDRDTIMLFAAGHGFRDSATRQFFLATRESRIDKLKSTSISWNDIAEALRASKARVIVFLDACHSGAAGASGTNDDAVSTLLSTEASITVIAAAKGRQESLEFPDGGAFTTALVRAITLDRRATDSNANGVIELAELYGVVKRSVVAATKGVQTPWIARNQMVGETPLF